MGNVLQDLDENSSRMDFKKVSYLKAKQDFKIEHEYEFVITGGNMTRQFFRSKVPICKAWDGKIGHQKNADGKFVGEGKECSECPYSKGVDIGDEENKQTLKCQIGYLLKFEHEDPEREYGLNINTESRINLENYIADLDKMGLEVDQVLTGITKTESMKNNGTAFKFRMIRELNIELSEVEQQQLNGIIKMVKENGPISVTDVKDMLLKLSALKGITEERAARLANLIADENGMVTESSKFV